MLRENLRIMGHKQNRPHKLTDKRKIQMIDDRRQQQTTTMQ